MEGVEEELRIDLTSTGMREMAGIGDRKKRVYLILGFPYLGMELCRARRGGYPREGAGRGIRKRGRV